MKYQKGFTLIELLVVIAIIGILSSVVITSLNIAREKGANAAVKQNLNSARSQAEIYYDTNFVYTGVCSEGVVLEALALADVATGLTSVCNESNTEWAISSPLKSSDGVDRYWCVDSQGVAIEHEDPLDTSTVCP